ncbi:lamin tail domain-containing protein [Patescibacteria group bacterium]|nr:lamin tail domain-containing protein [Patescibacteria group bacterium]MCG2694501.1 lamin tail domain-containing protein [Candidatus Parcubacteria bacterium]
MQTGIQNLKTKTNLLCKFVFVFLIWANTTNAQIVINEIMYDPDGPDTGREWIEIWNDDNELFNIEGCLFFDEEKEQEKKHYIRLVDEKTFDFLIPAGSYAVIIDNPDKFFVDYPNFSGIVFDSSFSLINSKEILSIKDSDLNIINSIKYSSDWGANGDGNSLQLIDGNWVASTPTPGFANSESKDQQEQSEESLSAPVTVESSGGSVIGTANNTTSRVNFDDYKIYANAGNDKIVSVGALVEFRGFALGVKKEPLLGARYLWTFGDGTIQEGQNITHFYKYPGDYVAVLNVSSGEYVASDRVLIKVVSANIVISKVDVSDNFVELFNRSENELNLSSWRICSGTECFVLPKDTIILPNKKVIFSSQITGLNFFDTNNVFLSYPNGEVLSKYSDAVVSAESVDGGNKITVQTEINPKSETLNSKQIQNSNLQNTKSEPEPEKNIVDNKDNENQLALVGAGVGAGKNDGGLLNKWTFSLAGLILVSTTSVLFLRGFDSDLVEKSEENEDFQLKPDDFKII